MAQRKIYKERGKYEGDENTRDLNEIRPGVPEELQHRLERNLTLLKTMRVAIQSIHALSPFVFKGDCVD